MQTQLKKHLSDAIFDIVIYGSTVKGKHRPRDIDILVVFMSGSLRSRLDTIQKMKRKLTGNLDIKQVLLTELFRDRFFARSGVLLEGRSVRTGKPMAEMMGFGSFALFVYNLEDKSHTDKVKFNYVLAGRNDKGIIEQLEGKRLGGGVVKIPIKNSIEFEEILRLHEVKFKKTNILEAR